jgi:hypothetical protein
MIIEIDYNLSTEQEITKVYNEQGNAISITPEQSKLVEEVINNDRLEDLIWNYLECQQEDVGDY